MPGPRLEHLNRRIRELIEDYRLERLVIPEFLRDYVWKRNRGPKLMDSLFWKFPISPLRLWYRTGHTTARLGGSDRNACGVRSPGYGSLQYLGLWSARR